VEKPQIIEAIFVPLLNMVNSQKWWKSLGSVSTPNKRHNPEKIDRVSATNAVVKASD